MLKINNFSAPNYTKQKSQQNSQPRMMQQPAQDTVSFKAVTPKLEKIMNSYLSDHGELWSAIRLGQIPKTEDNLKRLAKEFQKRKAEKDLMAWDNIQSVVKKEWGIDISKVKAD